MSKKLFWEGKHFSLHRILYSEIELPHCMQYQIMINKLTIRSYYNKYLFIVLVGLGWSFIFYWCKKEACSKIKPAENLK